MAKAPHPAASTLHGSLGCCPLGEGWCTEGASPSCPSQLLRGAVGQAGARGELLHEVLEAQQQQQNHVDQDQEIHPRPKRLWGSDTWGRLGSVTASWTRKWLCTVPADHGCPEFLCSLRVLPVPLPSSTETALPKIANARLGLPDAAELRGCWRGGADCSNTSASIPTPASPRITPPSGYHPHPSPLPGIRHPARLRKSNPRNQR